MSINPIRILQHSVILRRISLEGVYAHAYWLFLFLLDDRPSPGIPDDERVTFLITRLVNYSTEPTTVKGYTCGFTLTR